MSEVLDSSSLAGTLSASIDWGDGVVTPGDVTVSGGSSLVARIDYSLDTNDFFDSQLKKDLFEQAVDSVLSQLGDDLAAIVPSNGNSWIAEISHPGTGSSETFDDLEILENEIVIYAGGRELGTTLGVGGPGGFNVTCTDASFCSTVSTRGEADAAGEDASDVGPWGGSVSFDITTDFHYSQSTADLETNQSDFLSIAMHEVVHLFGFGTSRAWMNNVSSGVFNGPASRAANGDQGVTLSSGGGHWANGTTNSGQEAAMDPSLTTGTRKLLTPLDLAGLDDVGWELLPSTATINGSHAYGDNGVYDITVTLAGASGGTTSKTLQEVVTNVPPILIAANDQSVGFGESFSITDIGTFTDAGFAASETFTYTIDWGDQSTLGSGIATIDSVGSATATTKGSYDGAHTYASGGTYLVTVTVADDDGGSGFDTLQLTVGSTLAVEVAADQIAENAGANASSLTITRHSSDLDQPLTVYLATDPSEISIPASVEIPAGEQSVIIAVHAVDDDVLDGTQGVAITATATGFSAGNDTFIVTDHETLSAVFSNDTISENAGADATLLTISRNNTDLDSSLVIVLANSNPSVATIPATVVIPYGESSVGISVDALDNNRLGANGLANIAVSASGYAGETVVLTVTDHETLALTIGASAVLESAGSGATFATVTRNNTNIDESLDVTISIDDESEATVPTSVTILADEASATFPIDAIEDQLDDGPQLVTVTVMASGYVSALVPLRVTDAPSWHNSAQPQDVDGDGFVSPIDVLRIINDLNSRGARQLNAPALTDTPPYLDVNDDGFVSPVDALIIVNALNSASQVPEGEALAIRRDRSDASSRRDLEREIVFITDQFGDAFANDLIANIVSALDRLA
ncbi:MAG: hypothetical protein H8E66_20160 [Planctomycetes bacterium]|nr:hypothetical protein [Planctomycetota bacterium]